MQLQLFLLTNTVPYITLPNKCFIESNPADLPLQGMYLTHSAPSESRCPGSNNVINQAPPRLLDSCYTRIIHSSSNFQALPNEVDFV